MNLLKDYIKDFIQPYPRLRYTKGEYELRVLPKEELDIDEEKKYCLLYTSPSPRDRQKSRMPSSA